MSKKNILLSLIMIASSVVSAYAEKVWHMVTDKGEKIPVTAIDYIIQDADSEGFDIIIIGDDSAVRGVLRSTFEFCEDAGIDATVISKETIIGPYHGIITVKGLKAGTEISIFATTGAVMGVYSVDNVNDTCTIDVSDFPKGVYVIRTAKSAVKFIKD